MRIPAAITAASLTLAPATPAEPVEQLLDDVSATHETSITAINSAETDDEVRDVLIAWRKELIAASDELAELREEAAEDGLTKDEKATFDEAAAALKRERAGVRQLRSELLPDDEPVVVPAPIEGLGGILGTTAIDAFERSETGDAPIVFGIPGAERTHDAEEATTPTVVEEPTTPSTSPAVVTTPATSAPASTESSTSPAFGPEVTHSVERLQDTETSTDETTTTDTTTTETSSTTTDSSTSSSSSTTTDTSATTTASSTTTSSSRTVLENRTTSATSSSTTPTSSSSTTSKTSSATTTEDDDERDGDLADTGTPMRALIAIGMLSLMIGAALVLTGAIRPRGARK
ncbi:MULTISPECIES: hypothetical protein [unclassified Corynebacterium]|uniref:hypothetical protein n=1 Tax=unclassified Corynebacterium TaxID=2624378 RepID=UPI001EF4D8E4|nr:MULTISPECIES: hypothetical protein [unclassified Corynebacterium]MCG7290073.1 hypothetical protein [Corynebacterium sp. ACRPZ]MCG7295101.1 hypothetical protein [Corynebacterium sp. ACRPY]